VLHTGSTALRLAAGLDARAAAIVMRVVRNIVNTGRTIACTIHQPAIDIFEVRSGLSVQELQLPDAYRLCAVKQSKLGPQNALAPLAPLDVAEPDTMTQVNPLGKAAMALSGHVSTPELSVR